MVCLTLSNTVTQNEDIYFSIDAPCKILLKIDSIPDFCCIEYYKSPGSYYMSCLTNTITVKFLGTKTLLQGLKYFAFVSSEATCESLCLT